MEETFVTCPKCKSIVTTFWGKCPKCYSILPGFEPVTPPEPVAPVDSVIANAKVIADAIAEEYIELKEEDKELKGSDVAARQKKNAAAFPALQLNDEQAYALAVDSRYCLVSARAGSGKTRTIVSKMLYLIDQEGMSPDEVQALSFNTGVREEINERANKRFRAESYHFATRDLDFAKTFHSLAYHAESNHRILQKKDKEKLIRDLIQWLEKNPIFRNKVYRHFRNESFQVDRLQFTDETNYYKFLRNQTLHTLRGETVRSQGEKWIADFLFEHGIEYEYEKHFYSSYIKPHTLRGSAAEKNKIMAFLEQNTRRGPKGKKYREDTVPDFYLPEYKMILEHWGIDENETDPIKKERFFQKFGMTWTEYKKKMEWKRQFWNTNLRLFINPESNYSLRSIIGVKGMLETSVVNSSKGREAFESFLYAKLRANGIRPKKIDQEELEEKVWSRQNTRFVRMMETFINKFEQSFPDGDVSKVREMMESMNLDPRQKDFIEIGLNVVDHYYDVTQRHKYLPFLPDQKSYKEIDCDYNQLMANATKSILAGASDEVIGNIKVLLIDEYQDFSQLFYEFISAVLSRNPELKVFCVGDPWQAINRFMGADVHYFENFRHYFPNGQEINISKNYRSGRNIVSASNAFMTAQGFPGVPAIAAASFNGRITIEDIRNVYLAKKAEFDKTGRDLKIRELFNDVEKQEQYICLYMKRIIEIVESECNVDESVLILARTGMIRRKLDLEEAERRLKDFLSETGGFSQSRLDKIELSTIHSAKGKEADTVIILEANRGRMPLLHPDHDLYTIFGETADTALQDEARLFYVAITRPKKKLYILHDDYPSDYLGVLRDTGFVSFDSHSLIL
nr:UvrD-helicase domain-containing protein [Clostridia bacterium]